jgi:hypothetical protein
MALKWTRIIKLKKKQKILIEGLLIFKLKYSHFNIMVILLIFISKLNIISLIYN